MVNNHVGINKSLSYPVGCFPPSAPVRHVKFTEIPTGFPTRSKTSLSTPPARRDEQTAAYELPGGSDALRRLEATDQHSTWLLKVAHGRTLRQELRVRQHLVRNDQRGAIISPQVWNLEVMQQCPVVNTINRVRSRKP